MKTILCLLALAAACVARPGTSTYTDRYDNVNLDEILANKRLLMPYMECMLSDKAKCSPEAKELKSNLKEALENNCAKCTPAQKEGTKKVIGHLINKEPEYWAKLCAKYDPERKYVTKYEEQLKEYSAAA